MRTAFVGRTGCGPVEHLGLASDRTVRLADRRRTLSRKTDGDTIDVAGTLEAT